MSQPNNLPTLADLHSDVETAYKNDKLKLILNAPPHQKWVKEHPLVKTKNEQNQSVPAKYMPIDKVEYLMDRIFQEWKVEVLREGVMFQSIYVTVRIHYRDPVTGDWRFHDGVGAKSVQTDSGKSAAELIYIKDAAVMMALPSAKSYAIKDACEHLGKIFGRDLNRRGTIEFTGSYTEPPEPLVQKKQADIHKENSNYTPPPGNNSQNNDFEL